MFIAHKTKLNIEKERDTCFNLAASVNYVPLLEMTMDMLLNCYTVYTLSSHSIFGVSL